MKNVWMRTLVVGVTPLFLIALGHAQSDKFVTFGDNVDAKDCSVVAHIDVTSATFRAEFEKHVRRVVGPIVTKQVPSKVNWGNFRFRKPRLAVESIQFSSGSNHSEALIRVNGKIWMTRQKLRWRWRGFSSGFKWTADGSKPVAAVQTTIRALVASSDKSINAEFVAQSAEIRIELRPIRGTKSSLPLGDVVIHRHSEPLPDVLQGATIDDVSLAGVSPERVSLRVRLEGLERYCAPSEQAVATYG